MNEYIEGVKEKYMQYCKTLSVFAVFRTYPADDGAAHVEYLNGSFHYVSCE